MSTVRFGYSHILLYNEAGADLTEEGHAGSNQTTLLFIIWDYWDICSTFGYGKLFEAKWTVHILYSTQPLYTFIIWKLEKEKKVKGFT